jgi:membrane-associated phospholipid phosphatase
MSAHAKSDLESAPDARADVRILDSLPGLGSENTRRHIMMCGLFALAGILALAIDVPLSQALFSEKSLHWLHGFLESVEPFGQPSAVIAVSLGVVMCGGVRRGSGFRIAAGALLSGLAVLLLKLCVARVRPRHFNFEGTVLDTFSGILPGSSGSHLQSWPSGHTATAVGFCLALSAVFPKGRWLFRVLAVLVALQRIESGAHYLSDTLFAASVACIVHLAVFGTGPAGRWFDGVEAQCARFATRGSQKSPHV